MKKNFISLLLLLFAFSLVGCQNSYSDPEEHNSSGDKEVNVEQESGADENQNSEEYAQETEILSDNSKISSWFWNYNYWCHNKIFDSDSLWIYISDEDEIDMAKINCKGEILYRYELPSEYDKYVGWLKDNLHIMEKEDETYAVYDIEANEDVTNRYVEDNEVIDKLVVTEEGIIFVTKKNVESFEENYYVISFLDEDGNSIFSLDLDENTLSDKYGISRYNEYPHVWYLGNGIISIYDLGFNEGNYPIFYDLNRKFDFSIPRGKTYKDSFCSDGNYTYITSGHYMYDHDKKTQIDFKNPDVFDKNMIAPNGEKFSNGLLYGTKGLLDVNGNVVVDFSSFPQAVSDISLFDDEGCAVVVFENGYVTFVKKDGTFLFDPVKIEGASFSIYFKDTGIALINRNANEDYVYIDKKGEVHDAGFCLGGGSVIMAREDGELYFVGRTFENTFFSKKIDITE